MKKIYTKLSALGFVALLQCGLPAHGQTFLPGNPGSFGVDADLRTDVRHKGSFEAIGSHDWLPKDYVSGNSVFDTTGAGYALTQIMLGNNYAFSKRMQFGAYTLNNGKLMLDGTYARDHFGLEATGNRSDKTAFFSSNQVANKNADDPNTWKVVSDGTAIPSKSDIIDFYIHMRRNGTSIAIGNPSNLIVYLGAALLATDGDHHVDFEMFRDPAHLAPGVGFSNTGPSSTGGRHTWEFNADGSVRQIGNMSMSFSFNNTSVSDVSILLWVHYNTMMNINPSAFEFVKSEWNGLVTNGGYGFAKIRMKNSAPLPAFAAVNSSDQKGPQWGTNSKDGGSLFNNYAMDLYKQGQLAEAAIDLTALGVDPAMSTTFDRCSPPFRRVLVKSRSSSAFSSALQDFVGPHPFLDAPTISAETVKPETIDCTVTGVTLKPASVITGASYVWSTTDGNFISDPAQPEVKVNKGGTYTLTASLYAGCSPSSQNVIVSENKKTPSASASYLGLLTDANKDGVLESVTLVPEVTTDYDNPQLNYRWTGPDGFDNSSKSPNTNKPGNYVLTVTEKNSGCSCTAPVALAVYNQTVLPVKIIDESAEAKESGVEVSWSMDVSGAVRLFSVERSADGRTYQEVGSLIGGAVTERSTFGFTDRRPLQGKSFYRVKAVEPDGKASYSRMMAVEIGTPAGTKVSAFAHPSGGILVTYRSEGNEEIMAELYSNNGQLLMAQRQPVVKGNNTFTMHPSTPLSQGIYVVIVNTRTTRAGVKLYKQ